MCLNQTTALLVSSWCFFILLLTSIHLDFMEGTRAYWYAAFQVCRGYTLILVFVSFMMSFWLSFPNHIYPKTVQWLFKTHAHSFHPIQRGAWDEVLYFPFVIHQTSTSLYLGEDEEDNYNLVMIQKLTCNYFKNCKRKLGKFAALVSLYRFRDYMLFQWHFQRYHLTCTWKYSHHQS